MSKNKNYSKEQKLQVVAHYVTSGTIAEAARATNIPRSTVRSWEKSEWWEKMVSIAHAEHDIKLDAVFTNNIMLIGEQLQDRVRNGDYRLSKKDELIRVPMSGRDLSIAGGVAYDKRNLLRGRPTSIQRNDTDKHLEELKQHFERIANSKIIEGEIIKE